MNEDALVKHYDDLHKDLKDLGLDLVSGGSNIQIGSGFDKSGNEVKPNLKGKIATPLLNQIMILSLSYKS